MAVTSCDPIDTRGFARGNSRNRATTGYTVTYKVLTDDSVPSAKTVIDYFRTGGSGGNVPWIGGGFQLGTTKDPKTKCRSITPAYVQGSTNPNVFHVEVEWESILPQRDDVQIYGTQYSVAVEQAIFAGAEGGVAGSPFMRRGVRAAITNSAGALHDPQIEEELEVKILRFVKTLPKFNGYSLQNYHGTVNSDVVTIDKPEIGFKEAFPPYEGRLRVVGVDLAYNDDDVPEWRQTTEIWINPAGWRRKLLDHGTHTAEFPAAGVTSTTQTREKDSDGYPITQPVLLDGHGQKLDVAKRPPVYLVWITKPEIPFMPLAGLAW